MGSSTVGKFVADESLQQVADAVTEIARMNKQIAVASQQQDTVASELNRSLALIKTDAEASAESSRKTASAGTRLEQLAVDLRAVVESFHLTRAQHQ